MSETCRPTLPLLTSPRFHAQPALWQLDQRTVAVRFMMAGRERVLRGRGSFAVDCDFGGLLEIHCCDASGAVQLLVKENDWTGRIQSGVIFGCDYLIHLDLAG